MHSNRHALVCESIKVFPYSEVMLVCFTAILSEQLWRPSAVLPLLNMQTFL